MGFIYFNPNPLEKSIGDCTIRAISLFLDQDWYETYIGTAITGLIECDMPSSNSVWGKYLYEKGCRRIQLPDACPICYTVREFCKDNPFGKFLLGTGSHVVTVIDGNYYDTWDSGDQVPIFYWVKGD